MARRRGSAPLLPWVAFLHYALPAAATVQCYGGEGGFTREVWPHCQAINKRVLLYYGLSGDSDYLMLGLHAADHSGWSSLALAGNGGMRGASMIVVRKVDGAFVAEDRYGTAYDVPGMDEDQDVRLIFAEEAQGGVSWGVLMPVNSCDDKDYPIGNYSRWMLWALGDGHEFGWSTFHDENRGQFHANLISGPVDEPDFSETDEMDVLIGDTAVVAGEDSTDDSNPYICQIFDLRQLVNETFGEYDGDKLHAVKSSAVLDPDSEQYVHHMILYVCQDPPEWFEHGRIIGSCENMPQGCYDLQYAWAKGSQDIIMPPHVGMPYSLTKPWMALQMHYYNPHRVQGIRDSSGVRLSFAPELREIDAAVLTFNGGTGPSQRDPIPPGEQNFQLRPFNVPAACTNRLSSEINILGLAHHQHLTGTRMNIDVIRNGTNLGSLREEKAFDFNHQSLEETAIKQIHRGDEFVVTCSYDTSRRTEPTPFGDLSQHEMCWAAMLYWPAQDVDTFHYTPSVVNGKEVTWCGGGLVLGEPVEAGAEACEIRGNITSSVAEYHVQIAGGDRAGDGKAGDGIASVASSTGGFGAAILLSAVTLASI